MRWVWLVVGLSGCAGFSAIERGDWRRVYSEKAEDSKGPQALITREAFEDEIAAGTHREFVAPPDFSYPVLNSVEGITLKVGQLVEFRLNEEEGLVELQAQGTAAQFYWNPAVKKDEWVDGEGVLHVDSALFVIGRSAGKSTLRLMVGGENGRIRDVPVTVQ